MLNKKNKGFSVNLAEQEGGVMEENHTGPFKGEEIKSEGNKFQRAGKFLFYVLAGFIPLWIMPFAVGAEYGREVTFAVFAVAVTLIWLLSVLTSGEIRFSYSPMLWGGFLLLLVSAVSSFFSKAPFASFLFADTIAERFSTLVIGFLLMILAGAVFTSRQEVKNFIYILIFSAAVSSLFSIIQTFFQFSVYSYIFPIAERLNLNVIGTTNGAGIFYAVMLMVAIGILTGGYGSSKKRQWVVWVLCISSVLFLVNLVVINFKTVWYVMIGSGIFLFGLIFRRAWEGSPAKERIMLGSKQIAVLGVLAFSILMLFIKIPMPLWIEIPPEVSPSFRATTAIAQNVFGEGIKSVFLGSGPGTFGLDWVRHKDPSVNQTIFWQVRFNQGFSWVSTLFATGGVLGVLALVLFLAISLVLLLRKAVEFTEEDVYSDPGIFSGLVALIFAAFLYPANLTFILLLFIFIGILAYIAGFSSQPQNRFLKISHASFSLKDPWITFASSLISVFLIALSVAALYLQLEKVRVALYERTVMDAVARGGVDEAVRYAEKIAAIEDKNPRSFLLLGQVRIEKLRSLIQRAASGEQVQQEFQAHASGAIQNIQQGILLNQDEPALRETLGALYELIIPFIPGSEQFAFASYKAAADLDPTNPIHWVSIGRAGIAYADKLQLLAGQAGGTQRAEFESMRTEVLKQSSDALSKAIGLKADYAPAHFMMTQASLRLGNVAEAIRSSENAKLSAPFDIGIAFQLGLLHYQNGDLPRAEEEFLRAVSLNDNYSNARYFLGLIYDRKAEKEKAIEQFERIASLNPDNEEIQKILFNLKSGKSALVNIAPPGTPPEKRREAPIQDNNSR